VIARRLVVVSVLLSVVLIGCDTPSDLPHLQAHALTIMKDYGQRFDDLARRAELIRLHGSALPAEVLSTGNTGRTFRQAVSRIEENRRLLQGVPAEIQGDIKDGNARRLQQRIEVLRHRLQHAVSVVTSELLAVEAALAIAERDGPPQVPADDPDAAPIR
jgi:hypothetical protein